MAPTYKYQTHYMHARRTRDMPQPRDHLNEITRPTSQTKSRKRALRGEALPTGGGPQGRSVLSGCHGVAAGALRSVEGRVCRVG
jgi:hypothetical protein